MPGSLYEAYQPIRDYEQRINAALSRFPKDAQILKSENQTLPNDTYLITIIVIFPEKMYVRAWEKVCLKGGQVLRKRYSYNYGPYEFADEFGEPLDDKDLVEFRLKSWDTIFKGKPEGKPQLQLYKHDPHYSQDKLEGKPIDQVTIFDFLDAVIRRRVDKTPIEQTCGIRIKK